MTESLGDGGAASGLLIGVLFGFVLEGAGLACARKLTGQFSLRDFTLFKVLITAILVAATGLWLLEDLGLVQPGVLAAPGIRLWAVALGGMVIGAGLVLGGYCPATSIAGLGSGRLDALVFVAGMVLGADLFAFAFGWIDPFGDLAAGRPGTTVDALLGVPTGAVLLILAAVAAVGFSWGSRMEDDRGGPMAANWLLP